MSTAWIRGIRKGDVIRAGNSLRIVRDVTHTASGHTYVTLAIRRCSWTGRCYTVLTQHDLRSRGFEPTGKRMRLRGELDWEIEQNLNLSARDRNLGCCDVRSVR